MAKKRPAGDGMLRKRDDLNLWEGRLVIGQENSGK